MRQPFDEVFDILGFKAKHKLIPISINFKNLAETTFIRCDKLRLMQVVSILLKNAIQYTPQDGKIHVTIRLIPRKGNKAIKKGLLHPELKAYHGSINMLEVSVRDNGVGIHKNNIERLFEYDGFIRSVKSK